MKTIKYIEVSPELKSKVNNIKNRILFLSPSVESGQERECRRDDFESLANSNIGVGGFGKVYKVRHKVSQNTYAIKVISKQKIIEHDLVEQIKLEVEIMYKLNHPYVVKLYNHYEDDESFYLILEYAPKGQIYTLLKKEGRFSERVSAQYLREVISACQYLHSLDPPIIHRDIKPENILLDGDGAVKLADFGWSNFFSEQKSRQTYCGTPEYLAPEMIRQVGHDKSLDIWNLGVLLFELLTGSPPFEGASQAILFENIVNYRVKWPKSFNGVAKDLINKLLKTEPAQRIKLNEICEHPWFVANPPIRPVQSIVGEQPQSIISSQIKSLDYKVISPPTTTIPQAVAAKAKPRQSLLEQKLEQISQQSQAPADQALVADLTQKLNSAQTEIQDLKTQVQLNQHTLEKCINEKNDLQHELAQRQDLTSQAEKDNEIKRLQEELSKQRSLNKNREQILQELDQKQKQVREGETQLKLAKNDLTLQEQQSKSFQEKLQRQNIKIEELEKKLQKSQNLAFELEKTKEELKISSEATIDFLKQKLLNNLGQSAITTLEASATEQTTQHRQFIEVLNMCKQDMAEILEQVKQQLQAETLENDKLRSELIAQGKRMIEMRQEFEAIITKTKQESSTEMQTEVKLTQAKLNEEIKILIKDCQQKESKIRVLEKQEKKYAMEKEEQRTLKEQIRELKDKLRDVETDRDLIEQEKLLLLESVRFRENAVKSLTEKLQEHGLSL